jgi:HEAT repeat protein
MFRAATCLLILITSCGSSPGQTEPLPQPRVFSEDLVIQSLIEALADADYEVRSHLGSALASYGSRAAPLLIKALQDDSRERRAGAAYALSQMKPPTPEALPALLNAVKDPEDMVRREAAYAINRIVRYQQASVETLPLPKIDQLPPVDPTPGGTR